MEYERRWDAENLAMAQELYSTKSFSSVAEIFPKAPIIGWVLLFRCKPWLFSWGICLKLFSLHLTRSFELRKVYILLWIWWMRKSYQVECEHSVRFWFQAWNVTGHSRNGSPVGQKVDSATATNTNFHKTFVTPTPILCLFTKKYEQHTKHHARVILYEKNNFARY